MHLRIVDRRKLKRVRNNNDFLISLLQMLTVIEKCNIHRLLTLLCLYPGPYASRMISPLTLTLTRNHSILVLTKVFQSQQPLLTYNKRALNNFKFIVNSDINVWNKHGKFYLYTKDRTCWVYSMIYDFSPTLFYIN